MEVQAEDILIKLPGAGNIVGMGNRQYLAHGPSDGLSAPSAILAAEDGAAVDRAPLFIRPLLCPNSQARSQIPVCARAAVRRLRALQLAAPRTRATAVSAASETVPATGNPVGR
jgi:hypothetical protein